MQGNFFEGLRFLAKENNVYKVLKISRTLFSFTFVKETSK